MNLKAALSAVALVFAAVSCDKHDWKETQVLHEGMTGGHAGHAGGDHAAPHGAAEAQPAHGDVHAKDAGHAPAAGAHAPATPAHAPAPAPSAKH